MLIFIANLKEAYDLNDFEAENLLVSLPAKIRYEHAFYGLGHEPELRRTFVSWQRDRGRLDRAANLQAIASSVESRESGVPLAEGRLSAFFQLVNEARGRDKAAGWAEARAALAVKCRDGRGSLAQAAAQQALWDYYKAALVSLTQVDRSEAVRALEDMDIPMVQEVKSLSRAVRQRILAAGPSKPAGRLPISRLLAAIRAEAERQGLERRHYVASDRTIRNWLSGATAAPPGFSAAVLETQEALGNFAAAYISARLATGSSELAANAKKEVRFVDGFHGLRVETPEDALLAAEAFRDLAERFPGGKTPAKTRKAKRK